MVGLNGPQSIFQPKRSCDLHVIYEFLSFCNFFFQLYPFHTEDLFILPVEAISYLKITLSFSILLANSIIALFKVEDRES